MFAISRKCRASFSALFSTFSKFVRLYLINSLTRQHNRNFSHETQTKKSASKSRLGNCPRQSFFSINLPPALDSRKLNCRILRSCARYNIRASRGVYFATLKLSVSVSSPPATFSAADKFLRRRPDLFLPAKPPSSFNHSLNVEHIRSTKQNTPLVRGGNYNARFAPIFSRRLFVYLLQRLFFQPVFNFSEPTKRLQSCDIVLSLITIVLPAVSYLRPLKLSLAFGVISGNHSLRGEFRRLRNSPVFSDLSNAL